MYTFEQLLDIAGWRFVEDDGTEWRWGDKVKFEYPIGGEYVTVYGVIQGFDFEEEVALVKVATPFTGDVMEVRFMHLERLE